MGDPKTLILLAPRVGLEPTTYGLTDSLCLLVRTCKHLFMLDFYNSGTWLHAAKLVDTWGC